jgi:hypothetical protein
MTTSRAPKIVSPSAAEAAGHRSVADDAVRELVQLLARAAAHEWSRVSSLQSSPSEEPTND